MAERGHLAARVEVLSKARDRRVSVGSSSRVVLVVIFSGEGMRRAGIPIQIRDGLIGQEIRCARYFCVFRERLNERWIGRIEGESIWICRGHQKLAVGQLVVEQCISDRV